MFDYRAQCSILRRASTPASWTPPRTPHPSALLTAGHGKNAHRMTVHVCSCRNHRVCSAECACAKKKILHHRTKNPMENPTAFFITVVLPSCENFLLRSQPACSIVWTTHPPSSVSPSSRYVGTRSYQAPDTQLGVSHFDTVCARRPVLESHRCSGLRTVR